MSGVRSEQEGVQGSDEVDEEEECGEGVGEARGIGEVGEVGEEEEEKG